MRHWFPPLAQRDNRVSLPLRGTAMVCDAASVAMRCVLVSLARGTQPSGADRPETEGLSRSPVLRLAPLTTAAGLSRDVTTTLAC